MRFPSTKPTESSRTIPAGAYGEPVADFVLRNTRVVQLGMHRGWVGPVDVLVEQGLVREIGHDLDRPARPGGVRRRRPLADARALGPARPPRPVDAAATGSTWSGPSRRTTRARGSGAPACRAGRAPRRLGHRPGLWPAEPTVAQLDEAAPDVPVVLISGDGHHAWLNSRALAALGLPDSRGRGRRDRVVRRLPAARHDRGARPLAGGLPPHPRQAAALGVVGLVDFEFGASPAALGRPRGAGLRRSGSAGRRTPTRSTTPSPPACAPATRCPAASDAVDDGPAQDHQRRLAQHPHGLVLRAVRRRVGPRARPTRPSPSCATCSTGRTAAGSRSPPTRSATGPATRR